MRKPNIRLWTRRLTLTAREAPAEMLLALYFFAIYSLNREHVLNDPTDYLLLMPIFFALSLLTNRWCRSPRSRIAYRLSPLAAVPFLWADVGGWVHSVAYPVTLIVSALTVFAGGWQRDNARFVERVLRYLSDAIASGLIALAAFLASCAIFFSIVYIFNILDDCSRGFTEYAAMASLLVVWPVLFLILDRDSERDQGNGFASGPFLDVLSNYILTPALLIYTAILYLYFAKIAIGWSLPKGGIAYLVFGYTITALVVQASQTLLQRRRYDWYYRRFGPIALPALAMFWIGVLYRVHQYGFTEARAYLVVCGTVMTLTVLMQFDRRTARYLYATVTGAALLALFTYVPGMTAADIGVRSQSVRADRLIDRLELADPTGRLTLARLTHADSTQKKDLRNLYESLEYLRDERGEEYLRARYGIGTERALLDEVVPERFREYVEYGWEGEVDTITVDGDVTLERGAEAVDLFRIFQAVPFAKLRRQPAYVLSHERRHAVCRARRPHSVPAEPPRYARRTIGRHAVQPARNDFGRLSEKRSGPAARVPEGFGPTDLQADRSGPAGRRRAPDTRSGHGLLPDPVTPKPILSQ